MESSRFAPEEYTLRSGFKVEYDPTLNLPPDIVSEAVGYEAAEVINTIRHLQGDERRPISVLELGVGTGISLVSMLERVRQSDNLMLHGIDIDAHSVDQARKNIENWNVAKNAQVQADISQADWNSDSTWESLTNNHYQVILFNPPYLPRGRMIREGYESVPPFMLYTDDEEGMTHYRSVLPRLPSLLSDDEGSSILVRNSTSLHSNQHAFDEHRNLVGDVMKQIPGGSSMTGILFAQISEDRNGSWVTISKTPDAVAPHKNPTHIFAQL